jgi:hypothetical protein
LRLATTKLSDELQIIAPDLKHQDMAVSEDEIQPFSGVEIKRETRHVPGASVAMEEARTIELPKHRRCDNKSGSLANKTASHVLKTPNSSLHLHNLSNSHTIHNHILPLQEHQLLMRR